MACRRWPCEHRGIVGPSTAQKVNGFADERLVHWAARSIVGDGMWCVLETSTDSEEEGWEPALLLCTEDERTIWRELRAWIADFPHSDVRLAAYTRDTLRRVDHARSALCYIADGAPAR
jgi:hypothetical protein